MKEYNIKLVLGQEDIESLFNGEITTFNFVPTEDTEYDDRINIHLGHSKDDVPLSEGMNLVVDNLAEVS
jgi:hypothetical protein